MHINRLKTILFCSLFLIFELACAHTSDIKTIQERLSALETASGGHIGIAAIDMTNRKRIQYHALRRFPLCSTSKVMAVSAILKENMTKRDFLQKKLTYDNKDLVVYSPVTEKHLDDGMMVSKLCEAAITHSDNTAMNLLMRKIGGPGAVTAFARSIGDNVFRLNRWEPKLNTAIPGDPRDTTTPAAMEKSLQRLVLGDALALPQSQQLEAWLKSNTTGGARIRAGVPKSWLVGDKTGSGEYGTTNDIGIIWPPHCKPIVVAIYFTQNKKDAKPREEVIASATRMLVTEFARQNQCLKRNIFSQYPQGR